LGKFRGQTFRWVLENALDYVVYLVHSIRKEGPVSSYLGQHKAAFKKYAELFDEVKQLVDQKEARLEKQAAAVQNESAGKSKPTKRRASSTPKVKATPNIPTISHKSSTPNVTATCTQSQPESVEYDQELCAIADKIEQNLASTSMYTLEYQYFNLQYHFYN
jgi:hypothetical protein